jgi:branched-chain amino acid aminotransferase
MSLINPEFFESILYQNGELPFLAYHYRRIETSVKLADLKINFTESDFTQFIYSQISINENTAKIKVFFDIKENRLHLFSLEIQPISSEEINSISPVNLCIYNQKVKVQDKFANCKVQNSMLYKDSIEYAQARNFQHSVILNADNEIVESSIASIYVVQNGKIYTPPISSGCVSGVMRTFLMENFPIEEKIILSDEIYQYDEIFLSNAVRGIILVDKIDYHIFETKISNVIREKFIELTHK